MYRVLPVDLRRVHALHGIRRALLRSVRAPEGDDAT
jgi:hypothetical protein